jgi:CRP/FNR family transcriptional regulator, cyclic AMP receptor protein
MTQGDTAYGPIYDPAVALEFFKSAGKPESVAQGAMLFAENEKGNRFLLQRDKMYLLLEGEVTLVARKKVIGTVAKGEIFGEMASITQSARSASALAKTACRVIALDDKQFRVALGMQPQFALMMMSFMIRRLRETIRRLYARNALSGEGAWKESAAFDRKLLDELVSSLSDDAPVFYDQGKTVVKEGQAGILMFVVLEGRVSVSIGESLVERLGPGGVFGEVALVDPSPRLASAVAETDCSLLPVNRKAFLAMVETSPDFAVALLGSLAERLRLLTSRLK